jgi:hypothetical protein
MLPEARRNPWVELLCGSAGALGAGSVAACVFLAASCRHAEPRLPWASPPAAVSFEHRDVRTLNADYRRTDARVLLRDVRVPTRAALDYAAYHANFIIADAPPDDAPAAGQEQAIDATNPFDGVLEESTLTGDVRATPLSDDERSHPLAFPPLLEYLRSEGVEGAQELEQVQAKVSEESWGLPRRPGLASQSIAEVFVHSRGGKNELWAKIEFQPWLTALGSLPDQDGDGVPEVYGKVSPERVKASIFPIVEEKYRGQRLSLEEVRTWANRLAAYWYPSFNTDLVPVGDTWPDAQTEPEIKKYLGGRVYRDPTIVLRGKPQGEAVYQIFFVKLDGAAPAAGGARSGASAALKLKKTQPTPDPSATVARVERELAEHGGSFERWAKATEPAAKLLRARIRALPPKTKALAGNDGFLFFRNSLEYAASGDLEKQKKGKNPLPVIVEFQKALAARGVDFLFVPVPTKVEIYPERLDPKLSSFAGEVVNPYGRKFLLALSKAGVEVVDLLPAFLEARAARESELVFQRQDTHWTDPGLRLAAGLISARIKKYPWYEELSRRSRRFTTRQVKFQRLGDLHSRLPEGLKARYEPEQLLANQVLDERGAPYEDDADSPVVVLGDSFTGVYQLMDAEHAGLSAHIAKNIGYPADLVMSYGGGPNVRNKLMRRGAAALEAKKLVIWVMTARDLHDFWEDWEPLDAK